MSQILWYWIWGRLNVLVLKGEGNLLTEKNRNSFQKNKQTFS